MLCPNQKYDYDSQKECCKGRCGSGDLDLKLYIHLVRSGQCYSEKHLWDHTSVLHMNFFFFPLSLKKNQHFCGANFRRGGGGGGGTKLVLCT